MSYKSILGNKIHELRKGLELNQEEFCKNLKIEITRASLSRIEAGKQMPSAEIIKSIINTYDISPYWLLDIEEPKKDEYIIKYESLNSKDKETINLMIDHLFYNNENNKNLSISMNTEIKEENKKSS